MSSLTARLGLTVDTTSDDFLTSEVASNWDILDDSPGVFTGSSTAIASEVAGWGSAQQNMLISDTTTGLLWLWNGTAQVRLGPSGLLNSVKVTSPVSVTAVLASTNTVATLTTTVPAGGRAIEVKAMVPSVINATQDTTIFLLLDSTVVQSTLVPADLDLSVFLYTVITPSAGSHTFSITAGVGSASTSTLGASSTGPIVLAVCEA